MNKLLLYGILIVLFPKMALCQEALHIGNDFYEEMKYFRAIPYYEKALEKKKTYEATRKLADCYRQLKDSEKAEYWYEKALEFPVYESEVRFYYALSLKENGKYERAKQEFDSYALDEPLKTERARRFSNSCDEAMAWIASPAKYKVANMKKLNTSYAEFSPVIMKNVMVFTTNRPDILASSKEIYEALGTPYFKLFKAFVRDTAVSDIELLKGDVNSGYHNGPATFTANTDTVYFTRTVLDKKNVNKVNGLEIFYASRNGDEYTNVLPFEYNHINYSAGHPFVSADGQRIYFVSDEPRGYGGTDIYCAKRIESRWSDPINLGPLINTEFDEQFPFEDENGVLYFSSDGHKGLGGFDIFRSVSRDSIRIQPENLGYPMNSSRDDFGIFVLPGKKEGYFSSNRTGGKGSDDIYYFNFLPVPDDSMNIAQVIEDTLKTQPVTVLIKDLLITAMKIDTLPGNFYNITGKVIDKTDPANPGLGAVQMLVINKSNGDTMMMMTDYDGYFTFPHRNVKRYVIRASKTGYFTHSVDFETGIGDSISVRAENNILENIAYEFNSFKLKPESLIQLDKIVNMMNSKSTLNIEMKSYTDARGSDSYNQRLSEQRAKSAKDYLVYKGIATGRISSVGLGETNPIVENASSEDDHQLNRRTEFSLVDPQKAQK